MKINRILILILVLFPLSTLTGCIQKESKAALPNESSGVSAKLTASETTPPAQTKEPDVAVVEANAAAANTSIVDFSGTTEAHRHTMVAPKFSGVITKVLAKEGERVKKGVTLVMLDAADAELYKRQALAAVEAAKIQFESVGLEYERSKALKDQNAIPQNQFDMTEAQYKLAKNGVEQASAALELAQNHLNDCNIPAPYNGIITKRMVSEGEYVTSMPPTAMLRIEDDETLDLRVQIPEAHLTKINIGDEVAIHFPALKKEIKSRVSRIINSIEPKTRSFSIIIEIENGNHSLWPGLFSRVNFSKPEIN